MHSKYRHTHKNTKLHKSVTAVLQTLSVHIERHFLCQCQTIQMKNDDLAEAHRASETSYINNSCDVDTHTHTHTHTHTQQHCFSYSLIYKHSVPPSPVYSLFFSINKDCFHIAALTPPLCDALLDRWLSVWWPCEFDSGSLPAFLCPFICPPPVFPAPSHCIISRAKIQ